MLSKARRCRTIALLVVWIYYAMYLFQPFLWADSFSDAMIEGRNLGPALLEQYAPGKITPSNDTVPGYEDAVSQKDSYTSYYSDPAAMSGGINTESRQYVLDTESTRTKVNLENDTTFTYKCQEKDAAGKCIRWSSSKEIMASAYKDCEETIIPTYDEPPRFEMCTGQHTNYSKACLSMMYANLTHETINQKCDTITLNAQPGQIYARCKDYYDWYKEAAGQEIDVVDDCNPCSNRDPRYCFQPDSYITDPPPSDATFFVTQRQIFSCGNASGWDPASYNLTNWYYRYSHSRIERLTLTEDATCPDFDELLQSGKCVVEKMVQCNASGSSCLTSINNYEYMGDVPMTAYSFKVPTATEDICINKCSYRFTGSDGFTEVVFEGCPVGEICTSGICSGEQILDAVPTYASNLLGTSEIVSSAGECVDDYQGTVNVVRFDHYRNGFPCKIIPGDIDNYEVCLYYDYLTVGDKSGAGQVTSSPAYNTWLAPFTSTTYGGPPPFEYSNQSLRGGSDVMSYRNVWQMRTDLNCNMNDNDCQALIDDGCVYWSTECLNEECTERAFKYQCGGTGKVVSYMKGTSCAGEMKCQGTTCMEEIQVETGNIKAAAAAAEILSNLRVDSTSTELFPGKAFECQNSPKNCCDDAVGGVSIADYVEAAVAMYKVGSAAMETFAPAMYEAISTAASTAMTNAAATVGIELGGESITATIGTAVVEFTNGVITAVAGEGAVAAVGAVIGALGTVLWVLAILYAIYTILSFAWKIMMACDEEDMATSVKLTLKLCHLVGTKPEKALGMNLKNRSVYCCFNSILARLIHEQGRAQIGRSWGTAESPDCTGLTPGQMAEMDFSVMDFTEYMKYVKDKSGLTDAEQEATLQKAMDRVSSQVPPE